MCTFRLTAAMCGCRDFHCKMRTAALQEEMFDGRPFGHVIAVTSIYRISGLCLGSFVNKDPNRTMVRFGLREDQPNSTQDCTDRKFEYGNCNGFLSKLGRVICRECQLVCSQPNFVADLKRSAGL
jgi:hypothetical protein